MKIAKLSAVEVKPGERTYTWSDKFSAHRAHSTWIDAKVGHLILNAVDQDTLIFIKKEMGRVDQAELEFNDQTSKIDPSELHYNLEECAVYIPLCLINGERLI